MWIDDVPTEITAPTNMKVYQVTRLYLMFLFTWQALFRVSDVGMNVLLAFIATFLMFLVRIFGVPSLRDVVLQLPKTVYLARKYIGGEKDRFLKFASCPTSHSIFPLDSCKIVLPNKTVVSARCSYDHPHSARRLPCNSVLLKTVRTSSGTSSLYPRQMFCYERVIAGINSTSWFC